MAAFLARIRKSLDSPVGRLALAVVYALMIALILIFFDGNGEFIYEAF
jgi:hypothetical protein